VGNELCTLRTNVPKFPTDLFEFRHRPRFFDGPRSFEDLLRVLIEAGMLDQRLLERISADTKRGTDYSRYIAHSIEEKRPDRIYEVLRHVMRDIEYHLGTRGAERAARSLTEVLYRLLNPSKGILKGEGLFQSLRRPRKRKK